MAEKAKQHYIPQVYLKPFVDEARPVDWDQDRPFNPGVWIAHPSAIGAFRRKSPSTILKRNRLYNLRDDDPKRPWLEEALGRLETRFPLVRDSIERGEQLSVEEYGTLLLFIGALSARTPGAIDDRQRFVDDLERIHRKFVEGNEHAVRDADRIFDNSDEAGRRLLPTWTQSYAEVVCEQGILLVNESAMEFITSDRPVCHTFLHIDELPVSAFPEERRAKVLPSVRSFFSYTALTPRIGFVSSPLLDRGADIYLKTRAVELVFALNQLVRSLAGELVISKTKLPFGNLTDAVLRYAAQSASEPRRGLLIYTEQDRYWVNSRDIRLEQGSHPLVQRILFSSENLSLLHRIRNDGLITELEAYLPNGTSYLKYARIVTMPESTDHNCVIETSLADLGNGRTSS